jgi:hypothetical protein
MAGTDFVDMLPHLRERLGRERRSSLGDWVDHLGLRAFEQRPCGGRLIGDGWNLFSKPGQIRRCE